MLKFFAKGIIPFVQWAYLKQQHNLITAQKETKSQVIQRGNQKI
jgi:hypothetical protein